MSTYKISSPAPPTPPLSPLFQRLPIEEGSFAYKYWQKPPVPVKFGIYVFDITNPDKVAKGATPIVIEKGPYTWTWVLLFNYLFIVIR